MKKILSLTILALMMFSGFACARCKYDSTGRHLIYDDTLRGQKRAAAAKAEQERKIQAAAAAKLDYDKLMKELEEKPVNKSNYIQNKNAESRTLPESTLKSNFAQTK